MGNVCMVGRQKQFRWRIEGISSLRRAQAFFHSSRSFKFGGYNWSLEIYPKVINISDRKEFIALHLKLNDAAASPSGLVLYAEYQLIVYDQLHNQHKKSKGANYFCKTNASFGNREFIPYEEFKTPSSGFLLDDNCHIGVKFMKIRTLKVDRRGMFECLSLEKKPASNSYAWRIDNFSELQKPIHISRTFVSSGHKWKLTLCANDEENDSLNIILELVTSSALPFKKELYIQFSLILFDQINGKNKKFSVTTRFGDWKASEFVEREFLSLDDFQDPSKGFLVENSCIIEASVSVLGSSTKP